MSEPTPEQVEAAARALWANHGMNGEWDAGTHEAHELCREDARAALVTAAGAPVTGTTSDGHHTFDELYDYRMLYNAHAAHGWLAAGIPVVKSWKHSDGEPCFGGGWFIVTAALHTGQVSNHYKAEHWGLFAVPEVDLPPEYDGHTPRDAAERLRAAAGVTPQEPPRTAAPTAKVILRGSNSDCASGVCPKGCSHLMWFCDQCSCEGGWGGTEELLEALAVQHICPKQDAAPQEREDDNLARASAWSDYRAEYGVHGAQSHRDFCAGWDAARGALDTGRGQR